MKKILATLSMALVAVAMMAQQPVLTFEKTEHDFGKINEADGRVTTVFKFKNEGMEPLVLSNVRASCGCTTPKWTREPIEPGQAGEITVTYNPNGRPGRFQKTITVTSNATEGTKRLYIKGEVIPKPAKPINQYSVEMGNLSLKSKAVNFGSVKKGENAKREIEYANLSGQEVKVELATRDQDKYLVSQTTLGTVKPNETGKFVFVLDSKTCPLYGPVEVYAYVVVDGKQVIDDTYKITLKGDIAEDFGSLSAADRQNAPILEIDKEFNLGEVAAGKKLKGTISLKNGGNDPLLIRRVYSSDKSIECTAPKSVKAGHKASAIRVEIATVVDGKPLEPGSYARQIQVITNDPNQPKRLVTILWKVK